VTAEGHSIPNVEKHQHERQNRNAATERIAEILRARNCNFTGNEGSQLAKSLAPAQQIYYLSFVLVTGLLPLAGYKTAPPKGTLGSAPFFDYAEDFKFKGLSKKPGGLLGQSNTAILAS